MVNSVNSANSSNWPRADQVDAARVSGVQPGIAQTASTLAQPAVAGRTAARSRAGEARDGIVSPSRSAGRAAPQSRPVRADDGDGVTLKPPVAADPAGEIADPVSMQQYNALYRPSSENNDARLSTLANHNDQLQIRGCFGMTHFVMRLASEYGHEPQADLYSASAATLEMYHRGGAAGHDHVESEVNRSQAGCDAGYWDIELPNHERWPANFVRQRGQSAQAVSDQVIDSLRGAFAANGPEAGASAQAPLPAADMASINFEQSATLANGQTAGRAHIISVQRKFASGDYRKDQYVVYDNTYGAFRYNGFDQMARALNDYWRSPLMAGVEPSMERGFINYYTRRPGYSPEASRTLLASLNPDERGAAAGPSNSSARLTSVPPDPTLPPPVGGLGVRFTDETKKRAPAEPTQASQLFRPSVQSPEDVRRQGGFSAENTALEHVNLGTHATDLEAQPKIFDSAGYLGTFRDSSSAMSRLPGEHGKLAGYIYDMAPSPNMVNVDASLGGKRNSGEFAAMGRIGWTQIRGWREVKDGKTGAWQRNPDYRWDVYDQTRTAGAQPQLAHYRADDPALGDPAFKSWISKSRGADGKEHVALTQEADNAAAQFYSHAVEREKYIASQTKDHANYRGAIRIAPSVDKGPEGDPGSIYAYDSAPASRAYAGPAVADPNAVHEFRYGEDGRFHSATEPNRVLRVNSDGQLFLGNLPDQPTSRNGVFEYTPDHRLMHVEDGKYLSSNGYDQPVTVRATGTGSESQWTVTDDRRNALKPFSVQSPPSYGGKLLIDPQDGSEHNHLYVSKHDQAESMQTYVGNSGDDSNNTNVRRFVYGEDGRFHDANDAQRTLGVDSDGNLLLGALPANQDSRNGVFRYENGRLIHAEDGKYLTCGGSQSKLTVTDKDYAGYSQWRLYGDNGERVSLPATTLDTFSAYPPEGRSKLIDFVKDPDSALPAGTNRFVTVVPGMVADGKWEGNEDKLKDAGKAAAWLNGRHAAWLFKNGYFGVASGPDALEIRRLDGARVGRLQSDPKTGETKWITESAAPRSAFSVPDAIWDWVKRDEIATEQAGKPKPAM